MKTCFYPILLLLFFVFSCNNDSQPKPGIIEIIPMSDGPGVEVQIKGTNFSSDVAVFFNGTPASIISSSERLIITTVPESASTGKITVANGDVTVESLEDFIVLEGTWIEKAYIPFLGVESGLSGAVGFASAEKGYIGTGTDGTVHRNGFWCYDPSSDSWVEIDPMPSERLYYCVSFVIDEFAYVGLGIGFPNSQTNISFYRLDMTDNTWSQVSDFPGTDDSRRAVAFSIGSKGYVNKNNEMWEYNPETDDWTRLSDFPGGPSLGAVGAAVGAFGYAGLGTSEESGWWQYNPVNDNWTQKADFPLERPVWASIFVIGEKIYLVGHRAYCWEYDPAQDVWTRRTSLPKRRHAPASFSIEGKGYMGTGSSGTEGFPQKDLWEFEP